MFVAVHPLLADLTLFDRSFDSAAGLLLMVTVSEFTVTDKGGELPEDIKEVEIGRAHV